MKYLTLIALLIFLATLNIYSVDKKKGNKKIELKKTEIKVTSSAFNEGEMIPKKYTCEGDNLTPPLAWTNIPSGTKSLAIIVDDSDAASGSFIHWLVYNINPEIKEIKEDINTQRQIYTRVTQGMNDARRVGYIGPCPPNGVHRYFFKVYALDVNLGISAGTNIKDVMKLIEKHIIAEGKLMGKFTK